MRRSKHTAKALAATLAIGAVLPQAGGCTMDRVQAVLAAGLASTLTNLFNITSVEIANEVLDVDD